MALIVLCGQPCSGKSSAAALLKELLHAHGLEVILVDEPGLSMTRNESYKGEVMLCVAVPYAGLSTHGMPYVLRTPIKRFFRMQMLPARRSRAGASSPQRSGGSQRGPSSSWTR